MTRIALLGAGIVGQKHLSAYAAIADAKVVAVMTRDESHLQEKLAPLGGVPADAKVYTELHELLNDPDVDAVDVCLPTDQHHIAGMSAVLAGKHVIVECPAGRRSGSARLLARTARDSGVIAMPAMCTRFAPGFTWLKEVVSTEKYGRLTAAHFRRLTPFPDTAYHRDTERSGGAILDLHLHDTDYLCHLLGVPIAVSSVGRSMVTDGIDYVVSQYDYGGEGAPVISSIASWAMADGFPSSLNFMATFELPGGERTNAVFDQNSPTPLVLFHGGKQEVLEHDTTDAYVAMLSHFVSRVQAGKETDVPMDSSADSISVVEAERSSVLSGGRPQAVHGGRLSLMV